MCHFTGHTGRVNPDLRELARTIDPALLGARLKRARQRAGLTQGQTADGCSSTAYVSRIEAGQRRPAPELLESLAARLSCSLEDLLAAPSEPTVPAAAEPGFDNEVVDALRLQIDYADLSLRTGEAAAALAGVSAVLADGVSLPRGLDREVRLLHARALSSTGDLNGAIIVLEDLVEDDEVDLLWISAVMLLSRSYRVSGDLSQAVDVGQRADAAIKAMGLESTTEAVQLAVTVAMAHSERGDVNLATRICARAVARAEESDSAVAQASAYWNSSVVESEQGRTDVALTLAGRALALLETTEDARSLARLRGQLGMLQLAMSPPEADAALENLLRSERDLQWIRTDDLDRAELRLGQARARLLLGDVEEAAVIAEDCAGSAAGTAPLLASRAMVLLGQVAAARGRSEESIDYFRSAILTLSGMGADRRAAELWFELGSLLQEHGLITEAMDAYRRAAASTGLRTPEPVSTPVRSTATVR